MTLHSAKGLEFPYVFLVGMAEGVFPNQRSLDESGEEEERRLCYVGITRAREELTLSMARRRKRYREEVSQTMSRFLNDIDPSLFQVAPGGKVDAAKRPAKKTIMGRFVSTAPASSSDVVCFFRLHSLRLR